MPLEVPLEATGGGEQARVVLDRGRAVVVLGAAGTGKTRLLRFILDAALSSVPRLPIAVFDDPPREDWEALTVALEAGLVALISTQSLLSLPQKAARAALARLSTAVVLRSHCETSAELLGVDAREAATLGVGEAIVVVPRDGGETIRRALLPVDSRPGS